MKLTRGIRIGIYSTGIGLVTGTTVAYMLLGAIVNEAVAQTPYLNSKSIKVGMGDNFSITVRKHARNKTSKCDTLTSFTGI